MIDWLKQPPSAFDVVTAYFPETIPKGKLKLRPCLILNVLRNKSGDTACRISYGTTNLKALQRQRLDIIIQNPGDLSAIGLPRPTRFDLDPKNVLVVPWTEEFFGCWTGYGTPILGRLLESYVKEYAYITMLRQLNK